MQVQIADVDDHLNMLVPFLADLVAEVQPEWSVEQALDMCRTGQWGLVVDSDHPQSGFAMYSIQQSRFDYKNRLHIEAVAVQDGMTTADYEGLWDLIANEANCIEIVMQSKRQGWQRRGWTQGWINFTRPVKGGQYV